MCLMNILRTFHIFMYGYVTATPEQLRMWEKVPRNFPRKKIDNKFRLEIISVGYINRTIIVNSILKAK